MKGQKSRSRPSGSDKAPGTPRRADLEAALHQAQEALESRDDFLRLAGHELRGPLAAIQLQADALNMLAPEGMSGEEVARRACRVGRQVQRLAWVLDEVLDVTRASSGRFSLSCEATDLVAVIGKVVERVQDDLTRSGCQIKLSGPGALEGTWDAMRLEHALGALVCRALTGGGARTIEIEVSDGAPDSIQVAVRGGVPLTADEIDAVSGPFEAAVTATRPGAPVLALWLARQVVEAHGGTMTLGADPGGTSLASVLRLPRDAPPDREKLAPIDPA